MERLPGLQHPSLPALPGTSGLVWKRVGAGPTYHLLAIGEGRGGESVLGELGPGEEGGGHARGECLDTVLEFRRVRRFAAVEVVVHSGGAPRQAPTRARYRGWGFNRGTVTWGGGPEGESTGGLSWRRHPFRAGQESFRRMGEGRLVTFRSAFLTGTWKTRVEVAPPAWRDPHLPTLVLLGMYLRLGLHTFRPFR